MNDPLLPQLDGATALSDEELEGLIPSYIALRSELNEAEQANILDRQRWWYTFAIHCYIALGGPR